MRVLSSLPSTLGAIAVAVVCGLAVFGAFVYVSAELWAPLTSSADSGPVAVPLLDLWHSTAAGWEQPVRSFSNRWSEFGQKVHDLGIADQIAYRETLAILLGVFASIASLYFTVKLSAKQSYWTITKEVVRLVAIIAAIEIATLQVQLVNSVTRPSQLEGLFWSCGVQNPCGLK